MQYSNTSWNLVLHYPQKNHFLIFTTTSYFPKKSCIFITINFTFKYSFFASLHHSSSNSNMFIIFSHNNKLLILAVDESKIIFRVFFFLIFWVHWIWFKSRKIFIDELWWSLMRLCRILHNFVKLEDLIQLLLNLMVFLVHIVLNTNFNHKIQS